ncbi:MAG: cytidylate kinase family protein [Lachnospiraceae bacterium]|nr:cytidylate kinase family protein [Lachnospiraceae bacterium]
MNISITGNLGSGKSTICKRICEQYGFERYSTGMILRDLAAERGITLLEMNELMKTDSSIDRMIDDATTRISREKIDDKVIFDSRLAWHFAERTFKIFLTVSLDEAARRVYNDSRGEVETYASVEEAKESLRERALTENVRYREFYGIEYFNLGNYDLVLDSTCASPEILTEMFMSAYERYANEYDKTKEEGKVGGKGEIMLGIARFLPDAKNDPSNNRVYEGGRIGITSDENGIELVSGEDVVKAAADAGCGFVRADLISR